VYGVWDAVLFSESLPTISFVDVVVLRCSSNCFGGVFGCGGVAVSASPHLASLASGAGVFHVLSTLSTYLYTRTGSLIEIHETSSCGVLSRHRSSRAEPLAVVLSVHMYTVPLIKY
jgi:hypothetical protein